VCGLVVFGGIRGKWLFFCSLVFLFLACVCSPPPVVSVV